MGKSIRMQRDELVWETRVGYFTEDDWNRTKGWLQCYLNEEGANDSYSWIGHQVIIYNLIKDLTFEEALADFEKFEEFYGRPADKRRKLYNGMLKCYVYQYFN